MVGTHSMIKYEAIGMISLDSVLSLTDWIPSVCVAVCTQVPLKEWMGRTASRMTLTAVT
jgi:hypothetical protein